MTNSEAREILKNCFSTVFPAVEENSIETVSVSSVADWDSLKTLTLIAVVEEEFNCVISDDEMESFVSFDLVLDMLGRKQQ